MGRDVLDECSPTSHKWTDQLVYFGKSNPRTIKVLPLSLATATWKTINESVYESWFESESRTSMSSSSADSGSELESKLESGAGDAHGVHFMHFHMHAFHVMNPWRALGTTLTLFITQFHDATAPCALCTSPTPNNARATSTRTIPLTEDTVSHIASSRQGRDNGTMKDPEGTTLMSISADPWRACRLKWEG